MKTSKRKKCDHATWQTLRQKGQSKIKNLDQIQNISRVFNFMTTQHKLTLPLNSKLEGINIATGILELNQSDYEIIYLPSRFSPEFAKFKWKGLYMNETQFCFEIIPSLWMLSNVLKLFKNCSKCRIWILEFSTNFSPFKLTCLVTPSPQA